MKTQLMPMRDFIEAQGWEVYKTYVDMAPANDLAHRMAWRELLDDAAKRRFSVVLVFKLDRAFRSVKHMHNTLAAWELVGVIPTLFISSVIGLGGAEPWPVGANPNRLAAVAGFGRTSVAAAGDLWPTAWPLGKGIPGLPSAD